MTDLSEQIELDMAQPAPQARSDAARQFMTALNVGLNVLNARLLVLLALLGAGAMFGVAVAIPDVMRTVAAGLYAVLVLVPVLVAQRRM